MEAKEEIRERIDIVDLVGEYIELKRSGRGYKALSPFKDERTPSFHVSPDKQIWYDFSTNQGGDAFAFIMKIEGMDFVEAMKHLARKTGVELDHYRGDGGKSRDKKDRLVAVNAEAMNYFQHLLLKNEKALKYLRTERGFSKQSIIEFGMGYSGEGFNNLPQHLASKGFTDQEQIDGGLCKKGQRGLYSIFRGRIMLPLKDRTGQVLGFTGRLIHGDDGPKYLNTPATLIYDKSRHIYGLDLAKDAIVRGGFSVVVEGNLDVVASHAAGVRACVATAGTAMTLEQIKTLSKMAPQLLLAYDNDEAGLKATERAVGLAKGEIDLRVVTIEGAKDADELIQKDPKAWGQAIEKSQDAIEWLVTSQAEAASGAQGKRRLAGKIAELLVPIADPVARDHYLNFAAQQTGISLGALERKIANPIKKRLKTVKKVDQSSPPEQVIDGDRLVAVALAGANMAGIDLDSISPALNGQQLETLRQLTEATQPQGLKESSEYANMQQFHADQRYEGWSQEQIDYEARALIAKVTGNSARNYTRKLRSELAEAEASGDQKKEAEILAKIQNVKNSKN